MKLLRSYAFWSSYSIGSLLLSFWLAWQLSVQFNFLYPVWYSLLEIDQTVVETMPKHLYKQEFIATNVQEHQRLFSEIVSSIQNHGSGLEKIAFYSPSGERLGTLLTQSEITHLQDVANLIDLLGWFALVVSIFCLMVLAAIIFFRAPMPSIKKLIVMVVLCISLFAVGVLLAGAKKFFYWLHTIVFPADHQWFFYYEESLMSTLMKAPALFAPISILLIVLGLLIWVFHLFVLGKLAVIKSV